MEFTESFFERRLLHILTATAGRTMASKLSARRGPVSFGFSRKRRRGSPDASSPSFFDSIAGLTRSLDELVLAYSRSPQRAAEAVGASPRIAIAEVDGHIVWAPASDWKLVCHYLMSGGLDPGLALYFRGSIRPGDVFLDIGASLGAYTILAAILTGESGMVHAYEASPEAYGSLVQNLDENGFGGGDRVRPAGNPALDDLLPPGARVDLVRIGGEAAVPCVLRSMQGICRDNPQCRIVVDYCAALHPRETSLPAILEDIASMGFSARQIDSRTGEPVPLQRSEAGSAFSVRLLLEQSREMQWNG